MSTQGLRKCCHCGVWFRPHPRKAGRQEFCKEPDCRLASKRASQKKWSGKNPSYFRGEQAVERVRAWRREHPDYRKHLLARPERGKEAVLQDVVVAQPAQDELFTSLRNRLLHEISTPLQDLVTAQGHVLLGLTAMMTGDGLQDQIGRTLAACYERGQRIGGMVPWMQPQENRHERTNTDCSATTATDPAPVQLGRSPAGA